MSCSLQGDCCFIRVCRPSVEQQSSGEQDFMFGDADQCKLMSL